MCKGEETEKSLAVFVRKKNEIGQSFIDHTSVTMGLKIKIIEPELFESVKEFLRENFYTEEPLASELKLYPKGYRIPAQEMAITRKLEKNLSMAAFDGDGVMIGVVIIDSIQKGKKSEEFVFQCECEDFPESCKKLEKFFTDLTTDYGEVKDIHSHINADKIMDIYILCVKKNQGKKGIGSTLFEKSIQNAPKYGFQAAQCVAVNKFTQQICVKLGFKPLFSIVYNEYVQNGVKIFNTDMGIHKEGIFYIKQLF